MDRSTAILSGLTAFTFALGLVRDVSRWGLRDSKARFRLTWAKAKANSARRAAMKGRDPQARRLIEEAVEMLRRTEREADADLNADATLENISRTLLETAEILRIRAEETAEQMHTVRRDTLGLVNRLESLRPQSGKFDDSGHATA